MSQACTQRIRDRNREANYLELALLALVQSYTQKALSVLRLAQHTRACVGQQVDHLDA